MSTFLGADIEIPGLHRHFGQAIRSENAAGGGRLLLHLMDDNAIAQGTDTQMRTFY